MFNKKPEGGDGREHSFAKNSNLASKFSGLGSKAAGGQPMGNVVYGDRRSMHSAASMDALEETKNSGLSSKFNFNATYLQSNNMPSHVSTITANNAAKQ